MKNKKKRMLSNTGLKILSLLMAIVCWVAVALNDTTSIKRVISDIPINIDIQEETLAQLGLNIIGLETETVTITVSGDRVAVGQLKPEDFTATIQLGSSYGEGGRSYPLNVLVAPATTVNNTTISPQIKLDYSIDSFSPSKVMVKLDRIEAQTIPITANMMGTIDVPEGYIRNGDATINPKAVTVSGPRAELDRIDKAIIDVEITESLDKSYAKEHPIVLLDAEDNPIDLESRHLTLDTDTAQVVISILKETTLPLTVEFLPLPRNFPKEELDYTLSNKEIRVAGPVEVVPNHRELLLGFVDLSEITLTNNNFTFDVKLPEGFSNMDNVQNVTVNFPMTDFGEETFTVGDIKILNVPDGYEVNLVQSEVYNVKMIGRKSVLSEMSTADLVAEIDLSEKRDLRVGQYQYPVKISAPTKGLVWATGEHGVVIQIVESQ